MSRGDCELCGNVSPLFDFCGFSLCQKCERWCVDDCPMPVPPHITGRWRRFSLSGWWMYATLAAFVAAILFCVAWFSIWVKGY